jgi:hypothetical protein
VPLRSAFSPELLKPWQPNIVIVEAEQYEITVAPYVGAIARRWRTTS